jgi:hypothetical protein
VRQTAFPALQKLSAITTLKYPRSGIAGVIFLLAVRTFGVVKVVSQAIVAQELF